MQPSYDILIGKLDAFVRKYYQNQLIRGSLFSLSLIIVFFLAVNSLEYFGEFDTSTRTVLFYLFLISVSIIIIKYVIIPIAKIFRLGSRISNEHAASIIGNHFRDVEDKLINILQLKENAASQDSALLLASIDQLQSFLTFQQSLNIHNHLI